MFTRYAIYLTPQDALADAGASWLGWDVARGVAVPHPDVAGVDLATLTERPRKYGLHATVKAPFRLADGMEQAGLRDAVQALCSTVASVTLEGLEIATLGRFLALIPLGDQTALRALASKVVQDLDGFRAPLSDDELARRRQANLSARQDAHLQQWGYPHVMDDYRFHITLTGPVPRPDVAKVAEAAGVYFGPITAGLFPITSLTLAGERADGNFVAIERFGLG